jgi:hypothetical protein
MAAFERFLAAGAVLAVLFAAPALAAVLDKTAVIDGMKVEYQVVLPNNYDPKKAYPAILGFPPGEQCYDLVICMVDSVWTEWAEKLGYIVIEPAAANGDQRYFENGAKIFPKFFDVIEHDYKIEGGKYHIAGISAGGTSAFWIAALYPEKFWSVTGFPGSLRDDTPERLDKFAGMCVYMWVGELDQDKTKQTMQQQAAAFRSRGQKPFFKIVKGQEHQIASLSFAGAKPLFDQFARARKGRCG